MTTNRLAKSETPVRLTPEEVCDHYNAHLAEIGRHDVKWVIRDGKAVLDWVERPHIASHHLKHPMDRRGEPMSAEDTNLLNHCLAQAGSSVRYGPDGVRYTTEA